MYRLLKSINASANMQKQSDLSTDAMYSPKDVLNFLTSVKELDGTLITAAEADDGSCEITIGNTAYSIAPSTNAVPVCLI